ncbi:MAG: M20/M25/M40 family metallo-hydrolase, partial [Woeseiaceae bacterium]
MNTLPRYIVLALVSGVCFGAAAIALGQEKIYASPERMVERIQALSQFGASPEGGVSRVAFSDADLAGRKYIIELMRNADLDVRVDTAGNIIGRRAGRDDRLPPILFGSHIDSVPGGGNYDGDVGVIGAIEVIELLNENGIETSHPLEIVSFTDEEGGLTGSRAMIGKLTEAAMQVVSHSGMTIRDGIRHVGGDPGRLDLAVRKPGELAAFIELHIEQGAILD